MKEKKKRWRFDINNLSVVYSHFLIVSCVLLMSVVMLYISNQISLHTLTEKNLRDLQYRLEQNCEFISDTFAEAYSIPSIIQETRYYSYIKGEDDGYLPDKYVAVLNYLGRALQIPNYLARDSEECLVYLRRTNSACGKQRVFTNADDCFETHLLYEQTPAEDILEILRSKSGLNILPMEMVKVGTSSPKRQMTVIICDSHIPISVLCTYSEDALLDHLEADSLPDDTHFQITADNGTILEAFPATVTQTVKDRSYELHAKLPFLKASVSMWIPKSYFNTLLQPSVRVSWMIILATAVIGFGLCLVLAKASVKPLRELVSRHMPDAPVEHQPNELRQLGDLLAYSKAESALMEKTLLSNLLVRAFTGSVLSKEDVNWLQKQLSWDHGAYRVALFNVDKDCSQMQIAAKMAEAFPGDSYCYPVGEWEIGLLLQDGELHMQALQQQTEALAQQLADCGHFICGGVSGPMKILDNFHIAVRQARASIVRHKALSVFSGQVVHLKSVTWMQHERLYQSVLIGDHEKSVLILNDIAGEVYGYNSCREIFYNVRLVLRSAAEELGIVYDHHEIPNYTEDIPAWENIKKLGSMLDALFAHMEMQQGQRRDPELDQVLLWIEENYSDPMLCIESVSDQLGLPIKRISGWIKEATGMRFNEYVLSLRIKKACELLRTSRLVVEQVARQSGFSGESTFYRVFKNYLGVTPSQYRKCGGVIKPENAKCEDLEEK